MPVFVVVRDNAGDILEVKKRDRFTVVEGAKSAYSLAPVLKAIAEGGNPVNYYTTFTTRIPLRAEISRSPNLTDAQKEEFRALIAEFKLGDVVVTERGAKVFSVHFDPPPKTKTVIAVFVDP